MAVDLAQEARERGIKYFLISYVDLFGTLRAKLAPAAAIGDMAKEGAGFAGFASWLDMTPADPDVLAIPDPSSLIQLPWKREVGWLAADPYMNGKLVDQAPRNILKKVKEKAAKAGYQLKTGVECEYFLVSPDGSAISDAADTQSKPCYDQSALMRRYDVISEICDSMLELGWGPYQNDHEDANGQFEMNWLYDDCLVTADRMAFFKYMVKAIAEKHGLRATFMPKPFANLTGSGCHVHVSLWKDGKNLFEDGNDKMGLSRMAYNFIGGVMNAAQELCSITNPTVNSYKRINAPVTLSGATWSPNTVTYAGNNRTHMIRIPGSGRFEFRLADGATNPYLLPAALIVAGLEGIAKGIDPGKPLDINMYAEGHKAPADTKRLPLNLLDALRLTAKSELLRRE
ncbi:MAG: type III glutamate--ammonia ligase, partial [Terriglobia bacterium]